MSLQPPERRLVTEATLPDYISEIPEIADEVAQAVERRELVTAANVRRIVASDNPDEPLEDGDLLLVHEPPFRAYTDFSDVTVAGDFTDQFEPGTWAINDLTEVSTGGKILQLYPSQTHVRRALSWDAISPAADVEVVARVRVSLSSQVLGAVIARGSGAAGAERGYVAAATNQQLRLYRLDGDGSPMHALGFVPFEYPASPAFYWVRLRVHGSVQMAKAWVDGQPEPADWMLTAADVAITGPGFTGIFTAGGSVQTWDVLGVALDGAAAPKTAV